RRSPTRPSTTTSPASERPSSPPSTRSPPTPCRSRRGGFPPRWGARTRPRGSGWGSRPPPAPPSPTHRLPPPPFLRCPPPAPTPPPRAPTQLPPRLAFFELPTAGPSALDHADTVLGGFTSYLEGEPGSGPSAADAKVVGEMIGGGIWAVIQHEINCGKLS